MHLHIKRLSRHRRKEENLTLPRKYLSVKMCQLQMWLYSSTTSCSLCTFKSATIQECLAKKKSDQLSREEEKLFTWLAKRKLYNSKDRSIPNCKTGGQPIIFRRVPTARKSADVKSPLKKRRAKVVEKVCRQMTGGDEETEIKQYAKLYKRMPATEKDQHFHLTGCQKQLSNLCQMKAF